MANPYAPPQAVVADVNNSAGFERADPGTRLGAALLDGLIMVGSEWSPMHKSPMSIDGFNTQTVHVQLTTDVDAHCERARNWNHPGSE